MTPENPNKVPKIALLLDLQWAYPRRLLSGIARYASVNGPWAFYQNSWYDVSVTDTRDHLDAMLTAIKNWKPSGIVMRDVPQFAELLDLNVPTITIIGCDENALGQPYIDLDDAAVAHMGVRYLIERGFYNLAFCGINTFWSRSRARSFCEEAKRLGFKPFVFESQSSLPNWDWRTERPMDDLIDWLHTLPKPVGIMGAEDIRASQVIECCKLCGYAIPEQVSVLGVHNDSLLCVLSDPPLSSIALGDEKAGYLAAQTLDRMMKGESPERRRILVEPSRVVTRQSTDFFAIEDPVVAGAMHFIRENSNRILRVSEVVDNVSISRRTLEVKFKEVLNRTVYDMIHSARIDRICKMLTDTNLPIQEIASVLGFRQVTHMVQFFEKDKSMTPMVYRSKFSHLKQITEE